MKKTHAYFSSIKRTNIHNYPKQLNSVVRNADKTQCNLLLQTTWQLHRRMPSQNTDMYVKHTSISIKPSAATRILFSRLTPLHKCWPSEQCLRNSCRKEPTLTTFLPLSIMYFFNCQFKYSMSLSILFYN